MKWIKRATNRHSHPDIQAAGFWGTVAFDELCAVAGEFDLEDEVPAKYASARYLGGRLGLHQVKDGIAQLNAGLLDCIKVGLLEELEDGALGIPGWDGIQSDSSTPRVQRHRAKKRAAAAGREGETPVTVSPVTPARGGTGVTGGNGPEKRRGEKKRIEDPPPTPSAGAAGHSSGPKGNGRRKGRPPSPDVDAVRAEVHELVGVEYPEAAWDQLRARLREGLSRDDALAYVRWAAQQPWEGDQVRLDPTVIFQRARTAAGFAKAKAPPGRSRDSPRLVGGLAASQPPPRGEPVIGEVQRITCHRQPDEDGMSCGAQVLHRWDGDLWRRGRAGHQVGCQLADEATWSGEVTEEDELEAEARAAYEAAEVAAC